MRKLKKILEQWFDQLRRSFLEERGKLAVAPIPVRHQTHPKHRVNKY